MNGQQKAKEVVDKIKEENAAVKERELAMKEAGDNELALIRNNPDLVKMYEQNAQVGSENLAGELPLLKIHAAGRSTKNKLADGQDPTDGYFFYKPTNQQFKELYCHILTVSNGFRAPNIDGNEDIFNQIVGGVIVDGGDYKPFIMYFTGLKLANLWEFGKEASAYTKAKPLPIPMFALQVKLTTSKKETSYGYSWVVNFEIEKNEDGTPILVIDPAQFSFLKENVDSVKETIANLIASKVNPETPVGEAVTVENADEAYGETNGSGDVNPEKIPF